MTIIAVGVEVLPLAVGLVILTLAFDWIPEQLRRLRGPRNDD